MSNRMFCWHGTDEHAASLIIKEGFLPNTYFAKHLENALEFGGPYVFLVKFDQDNFYGPKDWQFRNTEIVSPDKIVRLTHYEERAIIAKEWCVICTSTEQIVDGICTDCATLDERQSR